MKSVADSSKGMHNSLFSLDTMHNAIALLSKLFGINKIKFLKTTQKIHLGKT